MINLNREKCNHMLDWEKIEQDTANRLHSYRAKVPGGWLLRLLNCNSGATEHILVNDKNHDWHNEAQTQAQ